MLIVMGDLNTKLGRDFHACPGVVGHNSTDCCNRNRAKLNAFCAANGLVISTTLFQHKPVHKLSWYVPGMFLVCSWYVQTGNMIDDILVNVRFVNSGLDRCVLNGVAFDTDPTLMVDELKL